MTIVRYKLPDIMFSQIVHITYATNENGTPSLFGVSFVLFVIKYVFAKWFFSFRKAFDDIYICIYWHIYVYISIGSSIRHESGGWGFESPSGRDICCLKTFDTFKRTPVRVSKMNAVARAQLTFQMLTLLKKYPLEKCGDVWAINRRSCLVMSLFYETL